MVQDVLFDGLDVHKTKIQSCVFRKDDTKPFDVRVLPHEHKAIRKHLKRLSKHGSVHVCYEAGFCGYALARAIRSWGYDCSIAATTSIPRKPGRKKKTDRLDAEILARALRDGGIEKVFIPEEKEDAIRGLVRCRMTFRKEIKRTKYRITAFLHTRGHIYTDGKPWTQKHRTWVRSLPLLPHDQTTLTNYLMTMTFLEARLTLLEEEMETIATSPDYKDRVGRLSCFRGIDLITAMVIIAEIVDFSRFPNAPSFMDFVGLVPGIFASGDKEVYLETTGAGNTYVRTLLVEAAWHYRHVPRIGIRLAKRQQGYPMDLLQSSWNAQQRLYRTYRRLAHKKGPHKAITAVARELAGFVWNAMQ